MLTVLAGSNLGPEEEEEDGRAGTNEMRLLVDWEDEIRQIQQGSLSLSGKRVGSGGGPSHACAPPPPKPVAASFARHFLKFAAEREGEGALGELKRKIFFPLGESKSRADFEEKGRDLSSIFFGDI